MKKTSLPHFQQVLFLFIFSLSATFSAYSSDSTIFRDDFNRTNLGKSWKAAPGWSIRNGAAYSFTDGTGGFLKTTASFTDSSYVIETKAKGFASGYFREFRITFGQANLSNDSMYILSYKPYSGARLTLSRSADNIYYPQLLDEIAVYPALEPEIWYTFKIAHYKNGLIQIYLDKGNGYSSIPLLEAIDTAYRKAAHIGWQTDTQTAPESFYVDWINAYTSSDEKNAKEKPLEDDLITQVLVKSKKLYQVNKLKPGIKQYTDRNYAITTVPSYLNGASFIQTAIDDKNNNSDDFLTFFVKKAAIVYIAYDNRATIKPDWLKEWTKTMDKIGTSDSRTPYLEIYSRLMESGQVYPNPVVLGGNLARPAAGSQANYLVAAVPAPGSMSLQAEDAFLSGAVAATNHAGYTGSGFADYINLSKDYIEWTVDIKVPGAYNLGFIFSNAKAYDRPLQITIDGSNVDVLSFSTTGSWESWSFLSGSNVFFTAGIHKIKAIATGKSGPNIDQLSLYYLSSAPVAYPAKKQRSNTIVKIVPENISKAYPNPFIKTTRISYTLQEKAHVQLSVYTLQGQQVKLLVNEIKQAGNYQTAFDASDLAAGVYFYRLQIGKSMKIEKLVKE